MLKITGKTLSYDEGKEKQEDLIEFVTEGSYASRGGITKISYPESELAGMEGCTTSLVISQEKVKLQRSGGGLPAPTVMEFTKGKRYDGKYETPFGTIDMEIVTNSISNLKEMDNGHKKLSIDYNICLKGLTESRNKLDIEILN